MALYKRNGIFHCDFSVNSQRYRQTLETADRREAIQRERDLISRAREGKLASGVTAEFSRLLFCAALDRYLAERAIRSQTKPTDGKALDPRKTWDGWVTEPLRDFFSAKRLNQITADDVRQFQAHRIGQGKHPNTVNHEVKALLRLLKRAKLLSRLRDDVQLLPVKKEPKSVLSEGEKQRLLETASKKPEWMVAYCAALLTANTSMRPIELRRLSWSDLDPFNRLVTVRRSKTEAGTRVIPLNDLAWSAFAAMKLRADKLGTYAPDHYIFHREWPKIDATRPMSSWRSAWRTLRKDAAKEDKEAGREAMPRLANLRFYDLRHRAITEMLEAGIPEGVIREVAGHVDPAMTRHYSHPRLAARRTAVEALMTTKTDQFPGGYVTNHVTKQLPAPVEVG
jgi:integrase